MVCGAVTVEQFGYGFGFTAFMLYLLYFADGPHKTAHYAMYWLHGPGHDGPSVCGAVGWPTLSATKHFFIWIIFSAIPGFIIAMTLKVDPNFGKRVEPAKA